MRFLVTGLFMGVLSGLCACSPGDARDATVLWRLADGRSCLDTAVVQVTLELEGGAMPGATATGVCRAHPAENQLQIKGVLPGAKLRGRGLTAQQTEIYRGEVLAPDPVPAAIELPMSYVGGP
jgi:hypothetical protein